MGTNIAYYHHIPLRPGHIYDFGQEVIPELGKGNHERTEIMFWGSFVGMVFAALSPLVRSKFYPACFDVSQGAPTCVHNKYISLLFATPLS